MFNLDCRINLFYKVGVQEDIVKAHQVRESVKEEGPAGLYSEFLWFWPIKTSC